MNRVIDCIIYCKNGKNRYRAFFEEINQGDWVGFRAEPLPDLSYAERSGKNKVGLKQRISSMFNRQKDSIMETSEDSSTQHFKGTLYWDLTCPTCGSKSFVRCPKCGNLFCWNAVDDPVTCPRCDISISILWDSTLKDIDANLSDSQWSRQKPRR